MNLKGIVKYFLYNFKANCLYLFRNSVFETNKSNILLITHNLGGGTENYLIQTDFSNFTFLRKIGYGKDSIYAISENKKVKYVKKKDLFCELEGFHMYFVNSLVDFSEKSKILDYLIKRKGKDSIKIIYLIHDFDCICKKNFNLMKNNFYCHVNCLDCYKRDINYEKKWSDFLCICDEIRCFSNSSKEILIKKYPILNECQITVLPHNMDYCKNNTAIQFNKEELNIGLVGNINSIPKGRLIVKSLLKYSKKNKLNITVIGKVNFTNKIRSKYINYTGKYKNSELGEIMQSKKISVVFFSSVWPETFSYVISELMSYSIPICCFDFGAQAEKVKQYEKGFILDYCDSASELYEQIYNYWRKNLCSYI